MRRRLAIRDDEDLLVIPAALLENPPPELQSHVQVREMLRRLGELVDRHAQPNLIIVNRHRLGHRQRQGGFADFIRAGIEADEVDRILRELRSYQRVHRHRHFFRRQKSPIAHHRAAHVQQHHGRATRHPLVQMQFEIMFVEANRTPLRGPRTFWPGSCRQPVPLERIPQRRMQIQLAHGIAVLIRLGPLDALAALARRDFFVSFALPAPQV